MVCVDEKPFKGSSFESALFLMLMLDLRLDTDLNDPRIESVQGYFPAAVRTIVIWAEDERKDPKTFHKDRIHMWAKVKLVDGGSCFVGLTLFNMKYGGHAEEEMPNQYFVDYSDDPTE